MEIRNYTQDGHVVAEIKGKLDSSSVTEAEAKITPLITAKSCMIIDMAKCDYVSSEGLGFLLIVAKKLSTTGGCLTLAGVRDEVKDMLHITNFSSFFLAYDSVSEALAAIKEGNNNSKQ